MTPNNSPGNLAFGGAANVVWSADAGTGSGSVGRITASPLVYNGHVFTLDADGTVSAFSNTGGSAAWRTSLKPKRESSGSWYSLGGGGSGGGYGGGLAIDGGTALCGERLRQRRRARSAERQVDLGKAARGAGARVADRGRRSRVRRHARRPLLLPRRCRRRRAVVGARSAAAGEPDEQRQPGGRRRYRRRAVSLRRPRRHARGRRLVGVVRRTSRGRARRRSSHR